MPEHHSVVVITKTKDALFAVCVASDECRWRGPNHPWDPGNGVSLAYASLMASMDAEAHDNESREADGEA